MLWLIQLILALAVGKTGTVEGKVTVHKKDGSDKGDHSDVVVYVADVAEPVALPPVEIRQRGRQFAPRVTAIAAGTTVAFPNDDLLEHNVFSHSANAEFDLGRFGPGPGKTQTFDKVGVAEIFCNIHKEMVSYIVVAPSRLFAVTGPDGSFSIKGLAPGRHTLVLWERFARPRAVERTVEVAASGTTQVSFEVREQLDGELPHKNKFGVAYTPLYR